MATTRLTLSVDDKMVARAKRYAARHHTSISKLVTDYLNGVTEKDEAEDSFLKKLEEVEAKLPKELHMFTGVVPEDVNFKDFKFEYLKEKYQVKNIDFVSEKLKNNEIPDWIRKFTVADHPTTDFNHKEEYGKHLEEKYGV